MSSLFQPFCSVHSDMAVNRQPAAACRRGAVTSSQNRYLDGSESSSFTRPHVSDMVYGLRAGGVEIEACNPIASPSRPVCEAHREKRLPVVSEVFILFICSPLILLLFFFSIVLLER